MVFFFAREEAERLWGDAGKAYESENEQELKDLLYWSDNHPVHCMYVRKFIICRSC